MPLSKLRVSGAVTVLAALLAVAGYGVFATSKRPTPATTGAADTSRAAQARLNPSSFSVDQSSIEMVEGLLRLPTRPEERAYAQRALRVANLDGDLAFVQAVRLAASRPRITTPETKVIEARLAQARQALARDSAAVRDLTSLASRAKPGELEAINDRLQLTKAMQALDVEELNDAQGDLERAGGDPQARMAAMLAEHQATSKANDSLKVVVTPATNEPGLVHRVNAWQALGDKKAAIGRAQAHADSMVTMLEARHDLLKSRAAARLRDSSSFGVSHDSATALVAAAQRQALIERALTTIDQRVDNQHQLSDTYASWIGVVNGQQRSALNLALRALVALLIVAIVMVLLTGWTDRVTSRLTIDRRSVQTLHMVTRVTIQVLGVLVMLLVVFGPPNNLGTFLGLAGAGLTVALQDFILGFIGWFVLMGRDGIRIGDLVEINDVTGEVVELGMFHTVLLETGNWSASGHPTGRRVTFANKFAIEGHYFNFSTSGQWVFDEVSIQVPDGRDPYAVAESLRTEAEEATGESARLAEVEWKGSRRAPHLALNVKPSVSLRPAPGGAEVSIRFVTRMRERPEIRSRLYGLAMKALGTTAV